MQPISPVTPRTFYREDQLMEVAGGPVRPVFSERPARYRPPPLAPLEFAGAKCVESFQRTWPGIEAVLQTVHGRGPFRARLGGARPRLLAFTDVAGGRLRVARGGESAAAARANRMPLNLLPAGDPVHVEGAAKYLKVLTLEIDPTALEQVIGGSFDAETIFRPRLMFEDPRLQHIVLLCATECAGDAESNALYRDGLSVLLATALGLLEPAPARAVQRGGLTPRQLRRVTELIEDRLADTVSLRELALHADLSQSYLCRAFRASTGCSPHQWQTATRVERAQQLLLEGDLPLAQIASSVGFTDQAHFTRVFSRAKGETPGAWRRSRAAPRLGRARVTAAS